MSHMSAGDPYPTGLDRSTDRQHVASWRTLYRTAGAAAAVTAVLIPIQIAVFIAYPYPKTVAGWYMLLQDKPLVGLVDLDLVLVVDNVLLVVIALAAYVALNTSVHLSWPLRLGYGCSPSACSSPLTRRCRCSSSAITSQQRRRTSNDPRP